MTVFRNEIKELIQRKIHSGIFLDYPTTLTEAHFVFCFLCLFLFFSPTFSLIVESFSFMLGSYWLENQKDIEEVNVFPQDICCTQ